MPPLPARRRGWTDLVINGSFWVGAALASGASILLLDPDVIDPDEIRGVLEVVDEVVKRCIGGGGEIVNYLKTGSAFYAPGASIAKMVEAIITDSHEVLSVCAYLDGQYGISDVYMNTPARLGAAGVEEVVEFDLTDDELAAYRVSAESVRAGLAALEF